MIVEMEVAIQRREQVRAAGEVAGIDELVLQTAPQAFDENVVQGAAASIHTDGDAALLQGRQKIGRGELGPLIRIPDFGLAETERCVECRQTEAGFHRVGEFPAEHETAEPIHHGDQVEKPTMHRNVRNIGAPDLVGPFDGNAAQQIRVDLVAGRRTTQVRFRIKGFDIQNTHQSLDAFAVDVQRDGHATTAEERAIQVQFVEPPEQTQILRTLRPRLVVVGRARHAEQFALLLHTQVRMLWVDPSTAVFNR